MIVEIETDVYLESLREAHAELDKIEIPVKKENLDMIMAKSTAKANLFSIIRNIENRIKEKKKEVEEMSNSFRKDKA